MLNLHYLSIYCMLNVHKSENKQYAQKTKNILHAQFAKICKHTVCSICTNLRIHNILNLHKSETNRIYDGTEAETRKSQASF